MRILRCKIALLLALVLGSQTVGAQIVINEIMYNSPGTDIEFVELCNTAAEAVDLSGWSLLDGNDSHTPCPLDWILGAGEFLVVAADLTLFGVQYPGVTNVNPHDFDPGGTGWRLGNGGDEVRLFDASSALHDSVGYDDGGDWPGSADGDGPSLELLHPLLDNSIPGSWDPSSVYLGTPGEENSVYTEDVAPVCKDGERDIDLPTSADEVTVTVIAYDNESLAAVQLFVGAGGEFVAQDMYDDGLHGDGAAGDSIWGSVIPAQSPGTLVRYYALAEDSIGQEDWWPSDAPVEYRAYTVDHTAPDLRITEALAINDAVNADEFGEFDDWIEIFNADDESVNLGGMFLSDEMNGSRDWMLPAVVLAPGEYLLVWADDGEAQGPLHTDFKLSGDGEAVALFETVHHGNVRIDGWKFGLMSADISMGIFPADGTAPEYLSAPTPGAANETSTLFSDVCINEFLATSNYGGYDDWLEVFNRGAETVDLGGCLLSDSRSEPDKWAFPPGATLAPGEFLVIYEDALGFGLSSEGDDVIMFTAPDSTTGLDFYDFGPQEADITEGRYPDGEGYWFALDSPTPGEANTHTSSAVDDHQPMAKHLRWLGNYPNPFNPSTKLRFSLAGPDDVQVAIYGMNGRLLRTLHSGELAAGEHELVWDGLDSGGHLLATGFYLARISSATEARSSKLLMLK